MTATLSGPAARAWRIPASRLILWELPFWFALFYGSLIPATKVIQREWFGIPMWYSDLFTFLSALFYGVHFAIQFITRRPSRVPALPIVALTTLCSWGAMTLIGSPLEIEDKLAMGFALLLTVAAPLQAAGLLCGYTPEQTKDFLNRLVCFLAALCLLYTAESLFDIGLRSEEGRNMGSDFGMQRVRGPLFGPSTGYLLLMPAIGWSLHAFFAKSSKRFGAVLVACSLIAALLGLGSRAALILLACYIVALALMMKQLKKKILTAALLGLLSIGAAVIIYGQADTQRLQKFEDNHRTATYETSWNILQTEGPLSFLTGRGYASVWNWYRRDALRGDWIAVGDNTIFTGYGISLYHSHSTLLEVLVEFGLPGLVWLVSLVVTIARLPGRSPDTGWRAFSWAIVISLFSFGFDLFIFKGVRINAIWWLFVLAAFNISAASPVPRRTS
jgi:O-antigen ligase